MNRDRTAEGFNYATGQFVGRTLCGHKLLEFNSMEEVQLPSYKYLGKYFMGGISVTGERSL